MNIYDIMAIERDIEQRAIENDGELTDAQWEALVEAQTKSIEKIENLCKYIRHLEQFEQKAKEEVERINRHKSKAEKRLANIKKYLTPYVQNKGRFDAGTFRLSTRKSASVELSNEFTDYNYMISKTTVSPDKNLIKSDLKAGKKITGASLKENINLQIK